MYSNVQSFGHKTCGQNYVLWFSLGITFETWTPLLHSYIKVVYIIYMVRPRPTTTTSSDTYHPTSPYTLEGLEIWVKTMLGFDEILYQI